MLLVLKTGGKTLRVREESFGCTIFDSTQIYAEGNHTVYDFLSFLSQRKSLGQIVQFISAKYQVPLETVKEDFDEFLTQASQLGWFLELRFEKKSGE